MHYPVITTTPAKILEVIETRGTSKVQNLVKALEALEQDKEFVVSNIFNPKYLEDGRELLGLLKTDLTEKLYLAALSFDAFYGLPEQTLQRRIKEGKIVYIYEPVESELEGEKYIRRLQTCARITMFFMLLHVNLGEEMTIFFKLLESIDYRVTQEKVFEWMEEDKKAFRFLEGTAKTAFDIFSSALYEYPDVYKTTKRVLKANEECFLGTKLIQGIEVSIRLSLKKLSLEFIEQLGE